MQRRRTADLYVASGGYRCAQRCVVAGTASTQWGEADSREILPRCQPCSRAPPLCVQEISTAMDGRICSSVATDPSKFPYPARSYILRTMGNASPTCRGKLRRARTPRRVITERPGSISTVTGSSISSTVGEWMLYSSIGTMETLRDRTKATQLPPLRGGGIVWRRGDFDNDGRPELVAGNLGPNSRTRTSKDSSWGSTRTVSTGKPVHRHRLTQKLDGRSILLLEWLPSAGSLSDRREIPTYGSFARASFLSVRCRSMRQACIRGRYRSRVVSRTKARGSSAGPGCPIWRGCADRG